MTEELNSNVFYSPLGNPEVWREKPQGYYTPKEWSKLHPSPPSSPEEPPVDDRPPEEKRRDAYVAEADPLFQQAMYYQAEADGLRKLGMEGKAYAILNKATEYCIAYAKKKLEIRELYPDA
jgi:hypothetical protein